MNVHDVFLEIVRASEAFPALFTLEGFSVGTVSALMGPQIAYPRELPSAKRVHTRVRLFTCKADSTDADLSVSSTRTLKHEGLKHGGGRGGIIRVQSLVVYTVQPPCLNISLCITHTGVHPNFNWLQLRRCSLPREVGRSIPVTVKCISPLHIAPSTEEDDRS